MMTEIHSDNGHRDALRLAVEAACHEVGTTLGEMTVLAAQHDPFRVGTPAGHRDGEWLAAEAARLGLGDRVVHLRGLHYMLVSGQSVKPDGTPYTNTGRDWIWMSETAAKAARWLGYIPFEQIKDARNTPPVVRRFEETTPEAWLSVGVEVEIPDAEELRPQIAVDGFTGRQPFKIVLYGEKTSLEDVLDPIASRYTADLFLPAGEISDTQLYEMGKVGAADGRPMIVFTVSDCDPAGWQMPISIGRKLQALREIEFPELEFQVHRVALTPDHVRAHGLPSTPLKETEQRADDWVAAMGVQQTEIDALAALNPRLLRKIVRTAVDPFFDSTLEGRVAEAQAAWFEEAQRMVADQLDADQLAAIREQAAEKLEGLRDEIEAVNEALRVSVPDDVEFPEIVIPDPELTGAPNGMPLVDSAWSWVEQTLALKASRSYQEGGTT
jgi:hypothetical protein